jgi:hypothetical protein
MLNRDIKRNRLRPNRVTGPTPIRNRQIKAMKIYRENNATSKQIAKMFSVSPSTLTVWAKSLGVTLRSRGRRRLKEPTSLQKQILRQAWHHTYETVGRSFGMKKQSIGRLAKRWWAWAEKEFGRRRISQGRKVELVSTPYTTASEPYARSAIVCFRLTSQQANRVREVLRAWGFGNRLSNGVACRAVLLRAIRQGRIDLRPRDDDWPHARP